jgi:hypothetical protein
MSHTALQQRPVSPRTRQEQQSRLWSLVLLLLVLGPPTLILGAILCGLARAVRKPRAFAWLAIGGVIGLTLLGWQWHALTAELLLLRDTIRPLASLLQPRPHESPHVQQIISALAAAWFPLWRLWLAAMVLAPLVASYIHGSRVKTAEELERERAAREERAAEAMRRGAVTRSATAPDAAGGALVLGVPLGGDLQWTHGGYCTYPATILARHLVIVGGSGSGTTETSKRLAYGAAKVYDWQVFYLDCKGDTSTAAQFRAAMAAAERLSVPLFPDAAYDGWRGDATALLNRLLAILDFTEPYYRDLTRMLVALALDAPPGPPRSSAELLDRLSLDELSRRYAGMPEARELAGLRVVDAQGVYNRYRAFFHALRGGLDGAWAFEDADAGYLLLRGLELKDQTASLGRYLLEDFAHFVAARKSSDRRVLLIVDEFPAIAFGGANAASLFEMVRSHGAGIVVTAQGYAGLGADADRILGAAAGLIIHQCADPERLLPRGGQSLSFQQRVTFTERGMGPAAREYAVGEGVLAETETLKVDADTLKQLNPAACVLIAGGRGQHVLVSPVRLPAWAAHPSPRDTSTVLEIAEIDRVAHRNVPTQPKHMPEPLQDPANDNGERTHGAGPAPGESIREY